MALSSSVNEGDDLGDDLGGEFGDEIGDELGDGAMMARPTAKHAERPTERLLAGGAASLSTAELLALCLVGGAPGEDAVSLARRLLGQFGSIESLVSASPQLLLTCRGLGKARVALLKALRELARREDEARLALPAAITDANTVVRYVRRRIGHCQREVFGCLFLDTRHRPIRWEILFQGTVNRAHVHSREILKRGLELNAAAMVLGHNHPSGVAEPSAADVALTRELRDLLMRIDIVLLDHIIVARGHGVSLANRGLMGAV